MSETQTTSDHFAQAIKQIVKLSTDNYYNPYQLFKWPDQLPDDRWWMSPELLSIYGTRFWDQFDEVQLKKLSKWESINFYSINIHGIRELLSDITRRIHSPKFELESEFFHHFLGEENVHMWFFAQFCLRYGSKIYPDKTIRLRMQRIDPDLENFLVFARILIFEEIVDYFNVRMANDNSLPSIIREINSVHHRDESRHLVFGRQIVQRLYAPLSARFSDDRLARIGYYLKRFLIVSLQALYNPLAYRDAGIPEPYKFRAELFQDPEQGFYRKGFLMRLGNPHYRECVKQISHFLVKSNIVSEKEFVS